MNLIAAAQSAANIQAAPADGPVYRKAFDGLNDLAAWVNAQPESAEKAAVQAAMAFAMEAFTSKYEEETGSGPGPKRHHIDGHVIPGHYVPKHMVPGRDVTDKRDAAECDNAKLLEKSDNSP